jgi:formamidopyrimidine-DNA glycosylase
MPELPEVETVVRQLAQALPGHRIEGVEVLFPDLLAEPAGDFQRGLKGSLVQSLDRRGKNILLCFSEGHRLVVNLGMTGQLLFFPADGTAGPAPPSEPTHPAIRFMLSGRATLVYADSRRFGSLRIFSPSDWIKESARLGPEPLGTSLSSGAFYQRLARSRSPLRSWLLDQTKIAGIGNIYASEALFRAEIHPKRQACSLDPDEAETLLEAIREVLQDAIRARGTTLRDYRTATGDEGSFGPSLQAYGCDGRPCPRCNTSIERIVFGNRSAFFCPNCQRTP